MRNPAARSVPPPLWAVATGQHDLLRYEQLRDGGLSHGVIAALRRGGALHELHRGVYKLGTPTPSREGRWLAAVYAAGPGSVLSHRDAGELHGLPVTGRHRTVDVTTQRGRAERAGIRLHRVRRLDRADVDTVRGIPVTSVARTIFDLAEDINDRYLRYVIHEAEVLRLLDLAAIDAAVERANGRSRRAITAALDGYRPRAKEEIEERLEAIAYRAGLRDPVRNDEVHVDGEPFELDRLYPHLLLCLEADGYQVHRTRKKFESDRRRDRLLRIRLGITVLRYTWLDVTQRETESEMELAQFRRRVVPIVPLAPHEPDHPSRGDRGA